ncbi:MAG TPA: DEAD/DEAH box helicase, partial [Myxococcales bacterium]|nr:DEAD/DEAH box helicase [Myxococcales bacterium]
MPSFAQLGAPEPLANALGARGYETPTPVQEAVLQPDAQGRDLLVSARTGSGKTVAFGLALAPQLLPLQRPGKPLALVVAPTRELAHQVAGELAWLFAGARIATCVGGADVGGELRALKTGAHVVVGTPGRLVDHLERGSLQLDSLRALVLDEADEMLDLGFRDELERILGAAPAERRTLLFSATIPPEIERLARKYTKDPLRIAANPPAQAHADIEVRAHLVAPREREHAVVNVLRYHAAPAAIVFCATREGVSHLAQALIERGFSAVPISGELSQAERTRALHALRDGRARVLVATDVAARGLDLPDVALVVQADPPHNPQVLQHRSGRTGRAGRKGVSVVLAPPPLRKPVETMLRRAGLRVAFTPPPDADVIRVHDRDRLVREIDQLSREPFQEDDVALARLLLRDREAEKLAAALVKLRREALPAPEELPLTAELSRRKPGERHDVSTRKPKGREREEGVWFRVNVGRSRKADPRWLLPILCRRGGVDRRMIGRIEVLDDETRFQVSRPAAPHFRRAAGKPDRKDPNIRITQV